MGKSLSMTKLYAINDNRQTIVIVSLDSNSFGFIHTDDQQIERINKMGKIEETYSSLTKPNSKKIISRIESLLN